MVTDNGQIQPRTPCRCVLRPLPTRARAIGESAAAAGPRHRCRRLSRIGPRPTHTAPVNAPPLLAPGAAAPLPEAAPARDADPIVLAVRQRLANGPAARDGGEQADYAALKAFYAQWAGPLWLANGGSRRAPSKPFWRSIRPTAGA